MSEIPSQDACRSGRQGIAITPHKCDNYIHQMYVSRAFHNKLIILSLKMGEIITFVCSCDILAPGDGDILAQGLIKLIEYSYQQGASSFWEAYLERTSKLSVLGFEQFGMSHWPRSFLGCA
jgi:hypothetical protein